MAASFIKKSDGSYYLRLTGFTNDIIFSAVSESGNTYTFSVGGTQYVSKPSDDGSNTYYTSSASPIPSGGILDNSRFPGTETLRFFSGSGTRDYILSFSAVPTPWTRFYLGGEALTWGGYAYPGDGYISNSIGVGVKTGGSWKNSGNIFLKYVNEWKEIATGWIKVNGVWKKFYQNFGNSSWINMLEGVDDAIDFGVKVTIPTDLTIIFNTNQTNINLQSAFNTTFGPTAWASTLPKRVIINSGVIIGSTSNSTYAINIPSGMGGTLRIDNNGSIQGAGGSANSGTGGNAIFAGSLVTINNVGSIYAGGGGGGRGGNGGQGVYTTDQPLGPFAGIAYSPTRLNCDQACQFTSGLPGAYCFPGSTCVGPRSSGLPGTFYTQCTNCYGPVPTITSGGTGGNGGVGSGYNISATSGSAGLAGGINAGTGGTGGTGGGFGASGTNGSVGTNGNYTAAPQLGQTGGPTAGGLAGFYVVNNFRVTWESTGTRLGRVS